MQVHVVIEYEGVEALGQIVCMCIILRGTPSVPWCLWGCITPSTRPESAYFPNHPSVFKLWRFANFKDKSDISVYFLIMSENEHFLF